MKGWKKSKSDKLNNTLCNNENLLQKNVIRHIIALGAGMLMSGKKELKGV